MNRPKYRIWDKENNCYWKPTYAAYRGELEDLSLDPSGELTMWTMEQRAIHESLFPDRFEVELFTGLTDKNGVGIFKNDIVQFKDMSTSDIPVQKGIVGFDSASFLIDSGYAKHYRWMDYACEVIGNISQHPERLENTFEGGTGNEKH